MSNDPKINVEEFWRKHGHFGLIRDEREETFKAENPFALSEDQLPPVDISTLPESMGIAEWLQIEDQSQQGSCQGNARTSAEEVAIWRETQGEIIQLSRQYAYVTSQMIDGIRGDQGSTISGGAEASRKYGSCLEVLAKYTGKYYTQFSEQAKADGLTRRLRTSQVLRSYDAVLRWLAHGIGGIVIGIGWNATCEPDAQGLVTSYKSGGGGHALALLDWTKRYVDASRQPFLEMVNSWSRRWGVQGRAFIAPKVIEYWCEHETVIGYTDMDGDTIKPRPFKANVWA